MKAFRAALRIIVVFILVGSWYPPAAAPRVASAQPDSPYQIALQSRRFVPPEDAGLLEQPQQEAAGGPGRESAGGREHVLIQLYGAPDEAQVLALAARGIRLLHYIPNHAWIASVEIGAGGRGQAAGLVRWAGRIEAADRVSPLLEDAAVRGAISGRGGDAIALMVSFAADVPAAEARAAIEGMGGEVRSALETVNALLVWMPAARWRELAGLDGVIWIEPPLPALEGLNDGVRQRIGVDILQASPSNLSGAGVDMLVYDGGTVAAGHPAFAGRLVIGDDSAEHWHPTHVAGTAAGSGAGSPAPRNLKGMAPAARVISYGFQTESLDPLYLYTDAGDIEHDWLEARSLYGAELGTASIGTNVAANGRPCEWEGDYGSVSQLIDGMVAGSLGAPYITTWAAGNERGGTARCGSGYYTTAPPGGAKNPIHVGATYSDTDTVAWFSSFGPTDDGRIKPTVVAPGCEQGGEGSINSTLPPSGYGTSCGTSMAAPAVAGLAALLIEQYRLTYVTSGLPLPSTIKGLLIHTAVDRGTPGPDYQYGYGRVDGVRAAEAVKQGDFREEIFTHTGEYHYYTQTVTELQASLTVSLAWDDAPATPSATVQLVNDLDLSVSGPDGTVYLPFVLNPLNPASPAATGADHLNNQEQVRVANPAAGTWTIRVRAHNLPVLDQRYSILFDGAGAAAPLKDPACYSLSTSANPVGAGAVSAIPAPNCAGGALYAAGTVVQLAASAQSGYGFTGWSGDAAGTSNPTPLAMSANRAATANFAVLNPTPQIHAVQPGTLLANGLDAALAISGSGFAAGASVWWNGESIGPVTVVSAAEINVRVPGGLLAGSGTASVRVENPPPGGGPSNAISVAVLGPYRAYAPVVKR